MTSSTAANRLWVDLTVSAASLWRFFALLRKGFLVETPLPCNLETLLCERLRIPAEYVAQRVQTVFLNGRAVDDVPTATVAHGAVVTLSAAMPGLVGATLRKGGKLTNLRSNISHRSTAAGRNAQRPGQVTVKLFNLICAELAPDFLGRGVLLPPDDFQDFLSDTWSETAADCSAARVDGQPLAAAGLPSAVPSGPAVALTVCTAG